MLGTPAFCRLAAPLAALCVVACAPQDAHLLVVSSLSPSEVETDSSLYIEGEGFPSGQLGSLHIEGLTHRPGQTAMRVDVTLTARALTANRAAAHVNATTLSDLGDHGTFDGHATLRFASSKRGTQVSGRLDRLELVLVSRKQAGQPQETALGIQTRKLLQFLGILLDPDTDGSGGLVVAQVRDLAPAQQAGLLQGDRIVRAGNLIVRSQSDLAPIPGCSELSLQIVRQGHSAPFALSIPLAGLREPVLTRTHALYAWLVVALLWFSATYGPLGSPSWWLAGVYARIRQCGPTWTLRLWEDPSHVRTQEMANRSPVPRHPWRRVTDTLVPVAGACTLMLAALLAPVADIQFHAVPVYFGMAAVVLWIFLLSSRGAWRARWRLAGSAFAQLVTLALVIGCACVLAGTRSLSELVSAQGTFPHRWGLFAEPSLFLLFPVFVLVMGKSPPRHLGQGPRSSTLVYGALYFGRILLCGMGTAIFLGGWSTRELSMLGETQARLLGALIFVGKAFVLGYLMHVARVVSVDRRKSWQLVVGLGLCALSMTIWWLGSGAGEQTRLFCGTVLVSTLVLVFSTTAIRIGLRGATVATVASYPGRDYALSNSAASRDF